MHERSETIQREDGKWINVYGTALPNAGKQLPDSKEYATMAEAVDAAQKRSDEQGTTSGQQAAEDIVLKLGEAAKAIGKPIEALLSQPLPAPALQLVQGLSGGEKPLTIGDALSAVGKILSLPGEGAQKLVEAIVGPEAQVPPLSAQIALTPQAGIAPISLEGQPAGEMAKNTVDLALGAIPVASGARMEPVVKQVGKAGEAAPSGIAPVVGEATQATQPVVWQPRAGVTDSQWPLAKAFPGAKVVAEEPVQVPLSLIRPGHVLDSPAAKASVEKYRAQFGTNPAEVPPLVLSEQADGTYEVLSGNARYQIVKEAGMETAPAQIIREGDVAETFAKAQKAIAEKVGPTKTTAGLTEAQLTASIDKTLVKRYDFKLDDASTGKTFTVKLSEFDFTSPTRIRQAIDRVANARQRAGILEGAAPGEAKLPTPLVRRLAKQFGMQEPDVRAWAEQSRLGVAELFGAADVTEGSYRRMQDIRIAYQANPAHPQLEQWLREAIDNHSLLVSEVDRLVTEGAQVLRGTQEPLVRETLDKGRVVRSISELADASGKVPVAKLAEVLQRLNETQFNKVAKSAQTRGWDAFSEVMYSVMLSDPSAHFANLVGSAIFTPVIAIGARTYAAGETLLRRRFGIAPQGGTSLSTALVEPEEVAAMVTAWTQTGWNGLRQAYQAIREKGVAEAWRTAEQIKPLRPGIAKPHNPAITGENLSLTPGLLSDSINGIGTAVRIPQTGLKLEDAWTGGMAYDMEASALAIRSGKMLGLQGKDYAAHVREVMANPARFSEINEAALQFKAVQTFTNQLEGRLGNIMKGLSHPIIRTQVPFITTMTNIFRYNAEGTPLMNLVIKHARENILAGGAEGQLIRGKMAVGATILTVASGLALSDVITGNGPVDPEARKVWRETHQPNSIRVGNEWVELKRFSPAAEWLRQVASVSEVLRYMDDNDAASTWDKASDVGVLSMGTWLRNSVSQVWAENVFDLLTMIDDASRQDPARTKEKLNDWFAKQQLIWDPSGMVGLGFKVGGKPGAALTATGSLLAAGASRFTGRINRAFFDETSRELEGVLDGFRANIPGLSKSLPARRDIFMNPETDEMAAWGLLIPAKLRSADQDPVAAEMLRLNLQSLPLPHRTVNEARLTDREFDEYQKVVGHVIKDSEGRNLYQRLKWTMQQPMYKEMTDGPRGGKAIMLQETYSMYISMANVEMMNRGNDKFLGFEVQARHIKERTGQSVTFSRDAWRGLSIGGR